MVKHTMVCGQLGPWPNVQYLDCKGRAPFFSSKIALNYSLYSVTAKSTLANHDGPG